MHHSILSKSPENISKSVPFSSCMGKHGRSLQNKVRLAPRFSCQRPKLGWFSRSVLPSLWYFKPVIT